MKTIKTLIMVATVSLFIGCGNSSVKTTANTEKLTNHSIESQEVILEAINKARAVQRDCQDGKGLVGPSEPLIWNIELYNAAYEHSQDLAYSDTFSHTGSGTQYDKTAEELGRGSFFDERIARNGYEDYSSIGENIAVGQKNIGEVVDAWLASPEHCANVMNPAFAEVGVAIVLNKNSKYGIYWTQNFGDKY